MPKRKRSDASDCSDDSFPTLLELASYEFAKGLWKCVIRQTALPGDSSKFDETFIEHCKDLVMEKLREYSSKSIVARCQSTIAAQVNRLMGEMVNEFSSLALSCLIRYVQDTPKWNEFLLPMWLCFKEKISEQRIVYVFESMVTKVDKVGLEAISEDELATYVRIWRDLSKPMKFRVFDCLAYCYPRVCDSMNLDIDVDEETKENMKKVQRDLRFMSMLLAEFDLSERRQIWLENWLCLVFGASASSVESLMKMCCEHDEPIEQFKEQWLAKEEIIDNYYCLLIRWRRIDELNAFLSSYSADESKVLDLAARILRSYFSSSMFNWDGYIMVAKIARSGQWLERAIRMPEFEYYLRNDDVTVRMNWCWYVENGRFDDIPDYISFFVPDPSERLMCERRYLRGFFLENDKSLQRVLCSRHTLEFRFMSKLNELVKLIDRVFDTVDEAAHFKKLIIFSPYTVDVLRQNLDRASAVIHAQQFVTMCLPDEQDLSAWKERFIRDALRCIRLSSHQIGALFSEKDSFLTWCLDSPEKRAQFKTELSIDDLYLVMERFVASDPREVRRKGNIANNMLRWWYDDDDHEMAFFKVQRLKRCEPDGAMFDFLLNEVKNMYIHSESDEEKLACAIVSCTNRVGYS